MGGGAGGAVSDGAEEGSHDVSNEEDEHVERTQVLEGGEVSGADEEVGAANGEVGPASGEEGSSGSSKEKEGKEQEKVADANPAYAKYHLEKRQMSEELKQRSE